MNIIGMIPARLGSTRVKNKNLRLLDNKPLIQHIVDSARKSKYLNKIYINSEADIFSEIAEKNKIQFYKRSDYLSSNDATNDDFAIDFIENISCDLLIQLLPTSPFISTDEIDNFIENMLKFDFETQISTFDVKIESVFKNLPINYDQKKKTPPSQLLEPIKAYACGIMGWKTDTFKENIKKYGAAYHGGDGNIGYFTLKGYSTVDIDNEEDFNLAEAIIESMKKNKKDPSYYGNTSGDLVFDADRERILIEDGVSDNNMFNYNKEKVSIDDIINSNPDNKSWSHTVVNSLSNSATLIAQMPGEGNRMHYHHNWDEWWYILKGEWEWLVEGERKRIKAGELVFIERNRIHKITAKGNQMAIRLAVSREDVDHVYTEDNYKKNE